MASSQVEFAASSSPFGYHHRNRCSNFNHFVRDNQINSKKNLRKLRFTPKREQQDDSSNWKILEDSNYKKSNSTPHSPLSSDDSAKSSNLGASSLVQIWEKRLTRSNYSESSDDNQEYSESNKTGSSGESQSSSPQGQVGGERERVRVADIIKRLRATCGGEEVSSEQEQCSSANAMGCGSPRIVEQTENRVFAVNSPRFRGRQAFTNLLMQMERDRHGDLNNLADRGVVSKFPHKGRIQSLLRLKLMQRGVAANDQCRSPSQVIRQPQGSVITRLRERFSTGVENGTAVQAEVAVDSRSPSRDTLNNNVTQMDNNTPATLTRLIQSCHCTTPTQNPVSHNKEEDHPTSEYTTTTSSEAQNVEVQNNYNVDTTSPSSSSSMADDSKENIEIGEIKVEGSDHEKHVIAEASYIDEEEEVSEEEFGENNFEEIQEVETNEQCYNDEASFDWISQISKPRSYWESLREAWYREVLETESKNEDICQLLQRKPVSTFLSSNFRERMDRLMESHIGTQTNLFSNNVEDDELDQQGRMDQLIAFLQEHMHSSKREREEKEDIKEEEEEEEEGEQEEHEEEILISSSYNEESDSINQSSSPARTLSSSLSTTCHYRDNEVGDDSDVSASTSLPQPSQTHSFYQQSPEYSSSTNHSIEMDLVYELRGHMKQLYQEMSELRKSIKSCMDMQMTLQKSMIRESHTAKGGRKSHDRALKKGNCCICYKMKADSLFYRCGHMCTCLKCANELQWKNGLCPICQATIIDVVRVYVDA
ncbi:Protein neuralized [Senna tora]|uniref:Protein neuralized n=1 Tax=Senna tora TaxID=362788 RepID=A0A835CEW8_9FABA|nr:Protein neuralized [Senna tora]